MSSFFSKSELELAETTFNKLSRVSFEVINELIDYDPFLNGKIMIGGALGKRTITKFDDSIELFIIFKDKDSAIEMVKQLEEIQKFEKSNNNVKIFFSYHIIEIDEVRELQPSLLKNGSIHYLRHRYILKFIKKFDSLIDIIKIVKMWNKGRKIRLDEIILELLCVESFYRLKTGETTETEILKSCFRTLHNAMEGISIIPREWSENSEIASSVSEIGIKIIDPGDLSNNLAFNLTYEQDLKIRNECLRAISILDGGNPERLDKEIIN